MISRATLSSLVRFGAGGVLSFATTYGVTALLHERFAVSEHIAAAAGFIAALFVNFFFLRHFVFRGEHMALRRQLVLFLGSTGAFRAVEYLAFLVLNVWLHMSYRIALPAVLVSSFLLKFIVYDRYVFARKRNGCA